LSNAEHKAIDISSLKELTQSLISHSLSDVRAAGQHSSGEQESHFRTAEYFLLEAMPYVDGAWEMLTVGNAHAALAISRWVLEAAMNLWWVVGEKAKTEQRLADLAGDALRQDAALSKDLTKLWPKWARALQEKAERARRAKNNLMSGRLDPLEKRMHAIKPPDQGDRPDLYVLYRICCVAAHPSLRVWERFSTAGHATVSSEPSDNTVITSNMAAWMTAAASLYLVTFACCLTQTGEAKNLKEWWAVKVAPLLGNP
jgi:hypothetical protein